MNEKHKKVHKDMVKSLNKSPKKKKNESLETYLKRKREDAKKLKSFVSESKLWDSVRSFGA